MFGTRNLASAVAAATGLSLVAAEYEVTFKQVLWEGYTEEQLASWAPKVGQVISSVPDSAEATAYIVRGESYGTSWEHTATLGPSTFDYHWTNIYFGTETQYSSSACAFCDNCDNLAQCSESYIWEYTFSSTNPENTESPLGSYRYDETTIFGLDQFHGVYTATLKVIDGVATTTEDQLASWRMGLNPQPQPTVHVSDAVPVETSVQEVQPTPTSEEIPQEITSAQEQETASEAQPEETSVAPSQNERSSLLQDSNSTTAPDAGATPASPIPSPTTTPPQGSSNVTQAVLPEATGSANGLTWSLWAWSACLITFTVLKL